jgi:hypothetical protein
MGRASRYHENRDKIVQMISVAEKAHAKPPTIRALADECGVGLATMHSYLGQLSQEGVLEWRPKSHRSLRLTPEPSLLSRP